MLMILVIKAEQVNDEWQCILRNDDISETIDNTMNHYKQVAKEFVRHIE